jgi:hypothetical protein
MDRSPFKDLYHATRTISREAMGLHQKGKYREAADRHYSAAFTQTPEAWLHHCDKRNAARYDVPADRLVQWRSYCNILKDRYFQASSVDMAQLKRVLDDENEPAWFRAEAAIALCVLAWDRNDLERAAEYLRKGSSIVVRASPQAIHMDATMICALDVMPSQLFFSYASEMGYKQALLLGRDWHLTGDLDEQLERTIWGTRTRLDDRNSIVTTMIPRRTEFTPRCKNVPPRLLSRVFVGGDWCDAMGAASVACWSAWSPCAAVPGAGARTTALANAR